MKPVTRSGVRCPRFRRILVFGLLIGCPSLALAEQPPSVVVQWNQAALQGVRDSKIGPPMIARALAVVHTCIYEAWAPYDKNALGVALGAALRQPPSKRHRRIRRRPSASRRIARWSTSFRAINQPYSTH